MRKFTVPEEIIDHVVNEYSKYSVELSGAFFDFDVCMKKGDILDTYTVIQSIINGDFVLHLDNPITTEENGEPYISGRESACEDAYIDEVYDGNMMKFLDSFNGRELETGWCRIIDDESDDDFIIKGYKLDFLF